MTVMSVGQKLLNASSNNNLGKYPNPGMSMRFSVRVGATKDLGLWQSCKNLQLELQYKKFAQGGDSLVDSWLPEKIAYSPVTLERFMEKASSEKVRTWLKEYVKAWNTYPHKPGGKPPFTDVTIELLDYQLIQQRRVSLSF